MRLSLTVRTQVEKVMRGLDSCADHAHTARAIWALGERLDLSQLQSPYAASRIPLGILPRTPDTLGHVALGYGRRH